MKKILLIVITILTIFTITGCANKELGDNSKYYIRNDQVKLEVKENTLTATGATIVMTNKTSTTFTYGEPYHLEKLVDEKWYILNPIEDLFFIMPAYDLKPNESVEKEYNWEYGYGNLEKGTYRLVTDFSNEQEKIYAAAEFAIK